jgi:hypothetical protein
MLNKVPALTVADVVGYPPKTKGEDAPQSSDARKLLTIVIDYVYITTKVLDKDINTIAEFTNILVN